MKPIDEWKQWQMGLAMILLFGFIVLALTCTTTGLAFGEERPRPLQVEFVPYIPDTVTVWHGGMSREATYAHWAVMAEYYRERKLEKEREGELEENPLLRYALEHPRVLEQIRRFHAAKGEEVEEELVVVDGGDGKEGGR